MKALQINEPKHLDDSSLDALAKLLHTEITDISVFRGLGGDEQTFVELITDMHLPVRVLVDWKWSVEELFEEVDSALSGHSVKLLDVKDDPTYVAYEIQYSLDGKNLALAVNSAEPNQLIEQINEQLDHSEFINVNLDGDEFAWILVPKVTDLKALAELVGFSYIDSVTVQHDGFPTRESLKPKPFTEHFDINQPLPSAIKVCLVMRHRVDGVLQKVVVKDNDGKRVPYQFQVKAGQLLVDTMKSALKDDIGYEGVVELHKPYLVDDLDPSHLPTYEMQVYLVADVPANGGSDKYTVTLEETPEIY